MDSKDVRQLAQLMKEMELTVLDFTDGDSNVHLERTGRQNTVPAPAENPPEQAAPQKDTGKDTYTITAPMIGVFYNAPSPDMKPFVSAGETVHVGDVLCIIEAMKMMNEITAEVSGVVTEVCVGNKQIVEYGHPLFRIRREEPSGGDE
jgi:acetyl-CoA carboxylase biotin carboxyl carrier protein